MIRPPGFAPVGLEPWRSLNRVSGDALAEAQAVERRLFEEVAPGSTVPGAGEVTLDARDAAPALDRVVDGLEDELRGLCAPLDYRRLFVFSRLGAALPRLRRDERVREELLVRLAAGDFLALNFGGDGPDDFPGLRRFEGWISASAEDLAAATVMLHRLGSTYRNLSEATKIFNFLRRVAAENAGEAGPKAAFSGNAVRIVPGSDAANDAAFLFASREHYLGGPFARWGFAGLEQPMVEPLALVYAPAGRISAAPYGGGRPFVLGPVAPGHLFGHLQRFAGLCERNLGLPFGHLQAIFMGLADLCGQAAEKDPMADGFGDLTGTMPVGRDRLLGGELERSAAKRLRSLPKEHRDSRGLPESVRTFLGLAAARGPSGAAGASGTDKFHRRALWPPWLVVGEDHHEVWLVDFARTVPFVQMLVDHLGVSEKTMTAAGFAHDADARTAEFDRELAAYLLAGVPGARPALADRRRKKGMPNVELPLSGRGDKQEVDVPLRIGRVLVAVQTWARDADKGIEGGDHEALRKRWKAARDKLARTDERYAERLISDPTARGILLKGGIEYVLPVLCGPFPEPVVSLKPRYWLRPPADGAKAPSAAPRMLEPSELRAFLSGASDDELEGMCRLNGWEVRGGGA